jgi:hypothetical protein
MATNDPPKTPAQPTVADVMKLVEGIQASMEKMGAALGDSLQKGMREGLTMAAMAREGMDPNLAKARELRQSLGGECPKCRMPMRVCGGPEMKEVPVLDADGKPTLKDGKPVTRKVEATKPDAEDINHVKMVVMPNDPNAARWFQFIGLNGVKFASRRRGRAILVPRKNDFAYMLNTFSNFEHNFRQSRKVKFDRGARWNPSPLHFAGRGSPMSGGSGVRYVS